MTVCPDDATVFPRSIRPECSLISKKIILFFSPGSTWLDAAISPGRTNVDLPYKYVSEKCASENFMPENL